MSCHGNRVFYNCRCVACRTIRFTNFNGLSCKLAQIAPLINIYLKQNWVECMMSSLISFAYFTHFPSLRGEKLNYNSCTNLLLRKSQNLLFLAPEVQWASKFTVLVRFTFPLNVSNHAHIRYVT